MALSWVIAGGGSGGHVTPALALAETIRRLRAQDRITLIGSDQGLETRLVPAAGFDLVALESRRVMGRGILGRVSGGLSILRSAVRAHRELTRLQADIVVSVGGFAAMPAVLAAGLRRLPIALVEPNAIPGRVQRLSSRVAARIFSGFESTATHLPEGARPRTQWVGVPLRSALQTSVAERGEERRTPSAPFRVFITGGSQGARQINETVMDALPELASRPLSIVHQTGPADQERVQAAYAKAGVSAEVVAFEHDMPSRYAWADFAICRAGALTIAELGLLGLPALLIPYPFAADDHQSANAAAIQAAGGAIQLDAHTLDSAALVSAVDRMIGEPAELTAMGSRAATAAKPKAADAIVLGCLDLLGERA